MGAEVCEGALLVGLGCFVGDAEGLCYLLEGLAFEGEEDDGALLFGELVDDIEELAVDVLGGVFFVGEEHLFVDRESLLVGLLRSLMAQEVDAFVVDGAVEERGELLLVGIFIVGLPYCHEYFLNDVFGCIAAAYKCVGIGYESSIIIVIDALECLHVVLRFYHCERSVRSGCVGFFLKILILRILSTFGGQR